MPAQVQPASIAAEHLALISFTLVVYDHTITFAQEVTLFWSGPWSASRVLYLSIRYLALAQVSLDFCGRVKIFSSAEESTLPVVLVILAFVVMTLSQCVITLRVWHLFHRGCFVRWLAVAVLIFCVAGAATNIGVMFSAFKTLFTISGTFSQRPALLFTLYLPALVVHTTMLSLKMYRFYISPIALQRQGIISRIVKEGIFMYTFATGALLYEVVSEFIAKPEVYDSALGGNIAVATTAVSVCRAMLSIRSLAATYHVDAAWLLNHAELSRVRWRRGATEGEIFVEVNEMDVIVPSQSSAETTEGQDDVSNLI